MSYPQLPGNVALTLGAARQTDPLAVALTFGAVGGAVVTTDAAFTASFAITADVTVNYDNAVFRGLNPSVSAAYNPAASLHIACAAVWEDGGKSRVERAAVWGVAASVQTKVAALWQPTASVRRAVAAAWGDAAPLQASASSAFDNTLNVRLATQIRWGDAGTVGAMATASFDNTVPLHPAFQTVWDAAGELAARAVSGFDARAYPAESAFVAVWDRAVTLTGLGGPQFLPPDVVVLPTLPITVALRFCALYPDGGNPNAGLLLALGIDPCAGLLPPASLFYILPAKVYMTSHNLTAQMLPSMTSVPLYDATLSSDIGSFAWQFTATGPESLFAQLAPTVSANTAIPQQLQITLDGMTWVFLVESLKRDHRFGQRRVSLAGRSATALVGAPWQREVAFSRATSGNAQQLAATALDLTGIGLDWGITDWLVPANAWSAISTPLAAVQAIADAAGGYLQSHRSAATLQVRHPYPPRPSGDSGGPWNWGLGAADIELAPDAVITSAIERRDGPDINAVYASGTTQGVLALVKRAGTAGDKLASLQTDALITASQAAQQRGLATLGKAGPQYAISIELPVLTGAGQPGVIDVGKLVQINESTPWRGRVRSVSVNAAMPTARQTITLERHL